MTWNPDQYARFRAERKRPWLDLVDLVVRRSDGAPIAAVVDLGCGTGELTRELHGRLGARSTLGIDSSAEMLAGAPAAGGAADTAGEATRGAGPAGDAVAFARADIEAFAAGQILPGERYDLVFSNAALHWLPDHPRLLAGLLARVRPGGRLAFQVPANADHASHRTAADVAAEAPFAAALGGPLALPAALDPRAYAELLHGLGVRDMDVELRIYGHELSSRAEVAEWVKGSLLTAYERRLPADLWPRFLARYRDVLADRLPDTRPYFYTYKRILVHARAP